MPSLAFNTAHPQDRRRSPLPSDIDTSTSLVEERPPSSASEASSSCTVVNSPCDERVAVGSITGKPLSDEPETRGSLHIVEEIEHRLEPTSRPHRDVDPGPPIFLCTASMNFFSEARYKRDKLSVFLACFIISEVALTV